MGREKGLKYPTSLFYVFRHPLVNSIYGDCPTWSVCLGALYAQLSLVLGLVGASARCSQALSAASMVVGKNPHVARAIEQSDLLDQVPWVEGVSWAAEER